MPRKQPKLPPCPWCRKPADRECDGPIAVPEGADRRDPSQTTCSAPVCSKCSQHVQAARPFTAIVCSRGRGGNGCEVIDNRADLCPFCAGRQGADPLPRAEHDEQLAQAIADALERKVIRGRFGDRDNKPENITGPQRGERLYLIDGGIVHRCYHAVPLEFAPANPDQPVNALLGFLRALRKLRQRIEPKPQWFLPVFDGDGPGWREDLHPGYKADRAPQDPELRAQWQPIRELLDAMGVAYVQQPGVEADDLIASYTEIAVKRGLEVVIVSDDKDLLQLLRGDGGPGSVRAMSAFGELELRGPEYVVEKFGVQAHQLADYLALAGDKVDGIPGAPGIGPKTTARLLGDEKTNTLGKLFDQWQLVRPTKVSDAIGKNRDQIMLSRELVELRREALPIPLDGLRPWAVTRGSLDNYFARLGYPRHEAALDRNEER